MTSAPREHVSTIVLSLLVTLSSVSGMCKAPPDSPTSYGRWFVVPFPHVNISISAAFQYRIYVTNPSNVTVGVTMTSCDGATTKTEVVAARGSMFFSFNSSYMMIGEGTSEKCVTLTADLDFGVQVVTTEKMDGFTSHPVNSWGSDYAIVTNCGLDVELCQVVIVANQTSQVSITLLGQGSNTISHVTNPTVTGASTFNVTLLPGQVYQLQRTFDITGARIISSVPVGVLSGAANARVGGGTTPGAFMEHMPPVRSAGTDYIVPLTPGQPGARDYVRVMALQDSTTVFIWTGGKRFIMKRFQYVTRPLTDHLMLIESDRPIVVVKFGAARYPTMSVIVPTTLFLNEATFVVTQLTAAPGSEQYVIIVQSNATATCESQLNPPSNYSIPGTDLIAMWYQVTTSGVFNLSCPSSVMAYSYVNSNDFSAQYPIAFSLGSINLPCTPAQGNPGDAIDNDCDGQIDEDDCTASTSYEKLDCGPVISGSRDVYGKSFTFLIPSNSDVNEIMLLFASYDPQKDVFIAICTPLDRSLVNMTTSILAGANHTSLIINNTAVIANGSQIFRDRAVHVSADNEISVTLVVNSPTGNQYSGVSALVIPDDVLGREYFIATYTRFRASCTIQITAFHLNTTTVKIRLRLQSASSPLEFEGQQYYPGQLICVDLEQYQSLQIQAPIDLSGTHVTSNKPVSVWSGGILIPTGSSYSNKDSISEHLPPTVSWGMKYIVRVSDMNLFMNPKCQTTPNGCADYLKIVSSEGDTTAHIRYNSTMEDDNTLSNPGEYLEILVQTELLVITADKPILVVQILQSYTNSESSASYVAPVDQYLTSGRIVFPDLLNLTVWQLLVTYSLANSNGSTLLAGDDVITTANSTLHDAGSAVYNSSKTFQFLSGRPTFPFGGHVFVSAYKRTMLHPIAFAMNKTNLACEITKSVPGDGKDNDCDGTVDEEECDPHNDPRGTDTDDDGMINEDCKLPPITSSLLTDSPTVSYSTPDLDYTASNGLTSATDQSTEDLATSFFQDMTTGYSQESTTSYSHDLTTSYSQDTTTDYSQDVYTSYSQESTTSYLHDLTTSYSQDLTTSYSQDSTTSDSQDLTTSYSQDLTTRFPQDLYTSYSQDLTTSYSHDKATAYPHDSTPKSVPEFTETHALASITDHTSELATRPPHPSTTFVSPGVASSVWSEMTSNHGTDSVISTDLKSVTDTFGSVFPTSVSHAETESSLGVSSAAPSSFSPSLTGLSPSSTESTSTTTISPSSSTQLSTTVATTTAAATSISHSTSASSTTTATAAATAVLSSHPCGCLCPSNVLTSRLQSSQIDSLRSSIQKSLEVDKSELSATTRKLISVNDQRPSAQTIGFFGVTLVVVAFSGIVLLDSGILIRNIMKLIQKCKRKK